MLTQEYKKFEWAKLRVYLAENGFQSSSPCRYFLETYLRQVRPLTDETKSRIRSLTRELLEAAPLSTVKELVRRVVGDMRMTLTPGQADQVNREVRFAMRQPGAFQELSEECVFDFLLH